jgi:8-oxo-dGTP pyrophosphatase MutT (NUDIX family)
LRRGDRAISEISSAGLPFSSLSFMLFSMDLSILNDQERFRQHVIAALAQAPLDYLEQVKFIAEQKNSAVPWAGAGVLLPLYFSKEESLVRKDSGQYVFLLNKRSKKVPQAGDLCAPGGGIHPILDKLSQNILRLGFLPLAKGLAFEQARRRGKAIYEKILFFLGNALRESWEEIRLSPFNVEFLGPMVPYRLQARRWIIFTVVGRVKKAWRRRLSVEVEKIVSIPLKAFFLPGNYALYSMEVPENLIAQGIPNPWNFPCLIYGEDGEEEILWGATFNIIRAFLKIVFDHPLPLPDGRRVIHRSLASHYFSGNEEL